MKMAIVCSVLGSNYYNGQRGVMVSELATGTPDDVRKCILAALGERRAQLLSDAQENAKNLADVNALIEVYQEALRWKVMGPPDKSEPDLTPIVKS